MKTTVELPESLLREIKMKAVLEGRKLKDTIADLLRAGLTARAPAEPAGTPPPTKLPVIKCRQFAAPAEEMTPERVAEILQKQDASWHAVSR